MSDSDSTKSQQRGLVPFKPGESGNPAGRPKGSRNKLGEAFLAALHDDFAEHGADAIVTVRTEKPDQYLKVIASTLPAQLNVKVSELDELTDDQLARQLAAGLALLTEMGFDPSARTNQAAQPQPAGKVQTIQ